MTEEDIGVPIRRFVRDSSLAEFERALETLIVLAHGQGRNFLAYLLIMALMHLREEEDQGRPGATHGGKTGGFSPDSLLFLAVL